MQSYLLALPPRSLILEHLSLVGHQRLAISFKLIVAALASQHCLLWSH